MSAGVHDCDALQFPVGQSLNQRSSLDFFNPRFASFHFPRNEKYFL